MSATTDDGLSGTEGTFNICSFWLVEALTRAGRVDAARLADARVMFEQMLGYANHLGLFAEETGPRGEALGNFPQAFTHLSLISAALQPRPRARRPLTPRPAWRRGFGVHGIPADPTRGGAPAGHSGATVTRGSAGLFGPAMRVPHGRHT